MEEGPPSRFGWQRAGSIPRELRGSGGNAFPAGRPGEVLASFPFPSPLLTLREGGQGAASMQGLRRQRLPCRASGAAALAIWAAEVCGGSHMNAVCVSALSLKGARALTAPV